ncbi:MAG: PAS domain S-box protein [Acidobacteria bacterium]|nr:PAS domain S-box protein [Acidobacteriota bacterium]
MQLLGPLQVLILAARPEDAELMLAELRRQGVAVEAVVADNEDRLRAALDRRLDVILANSALPSFNALKALEVIAATGLEIPLIVVSGGIDEQNAVECIKRGAVDYLLKDDLGRLGAAVRQAVARQRRRERTRRTDNALRDSQAELNAVFESAPVAIFLVDAERRIVKANRAAGELTGHQLHDLVGRLTGNALGCLHSLDDPRGCGFGPDCPRCVVRWAVLDTIETGTSHSGVEWVAPVQRGDAVEPRSLLISSAPVETSRGRLVIVSAADITERQAAEERLHFLNRVLRTIRRVNHLIVHEHDRERLLAETCRIAVEEGGFRMAWIGRVDRATETVEPVASAGYEAGYTELVGIRLDDSAHGHGPCGTAVREGRAAVVDDTATNESFAPWRKAAQQRGYRSVGSFPILVGGHTWGAMNVYADRPSTFGDQVVAMFEELSGDLGFALLSLETEQRRVRAEEALAASEERYRELTDFLPQPIFETDSKGRVLFANETAFRMFGFSREEARKGLSLSDVLLPEDRDDARRRMARLAAGERVGIREYSVVRKDGTTFPALIYNSPIVRDRQVVGFRGLIVDITDRKQAEEELAASEHQYRVLFEGANDAIIIFEPDTEVILEANPRACELYGLPHEELVGMSLKTLSENVARGEAQIRELLREGGLRNFETVQLGSDGSPIHLLVNSSVIDYGGRPAILSINRDVTDLHRLEEQLRQSQKMEAVGRLAGGVAHDFNNLLQAMLLQAQVLSIAPGDQRSVASTAEELEEQIQRGASLTRQLLLFSRREASRTETLDLNEVVDDGVKLLRRLLRENIRLTLETAEGQLPVKADRGQLGQVLMNLTINAGDAIPDRGVVTIRSGSADGEMVWLEVSDTGEGIPEEARDKLFEPFFTTKEAGKGTGLGLSVVHGIVTRHGGRIEVESAPGKGSTFRVLLPRAVSTPTRLDSNREQQLPRGSGERVLLVEDEDLARETFEKMLTELGYEVMAAASAEAVDDLAPNGPFDLLLTDLVLPTISGAQLAKKLAARWPAMKVILMSGYTEDQEVREAIASGTMRFLQKPYGLATLACEVHEALAEP